ncbi:hypothetical protein BST27_04695 [Mycobacterium intermedium]|uniref:Methyltransferase type 11 domain-containing protein n=1 Tax=Mycobacterium intermedium TaxID=28445 RepID=A0A1E3SMA3_MYCIE|nr:class I SAM-dependent methyltransferase [Mycobacterium intermedium]MCV6966956.1 methyltransferase domain-containing protein [Mycobacterium intermedium]ODR03276.1 hypothetical protein BHQ20_00020 [Mycobacterium intermedium]OPE47201.1 hypothetical protein BV508_22900 [Mycobacterium intermedium]ORB09658.1 hypothetical protein BST27_04695 [Mycobacterium intermedium]
MAMNICHRLCCSSGYWAKTVEPQGALAQRLQSKYGDRARIIHGDGADTGLPTADFSSVVCFTMMHHVPTPPVQNQLFAEAFRVLQPGGIFAGSDGVDSIPFRIAHFRDTCNPLDPQLLPDRLARAGFVDVEVEVKHGEQRWRAVKP